MLSDAPEMVLKVTKQLEQRETLSKSFKMLFEVVNSRFPTTDGVIQRLIPSRRRKAHNRSRSAVAAERLGAFSPRLIPLHCPECTRQLHQCVQAVDSMLQIVEGWMQRGHVMTCQWHPFSRFSAAVQRCMCYHRSRLRWCPSWFSYD